MKRIPSRHRSAAYTTTLLGALCLSLQFAAVAAESQQLSGVDGSRRSPKVAIVDSGNTVTLENGLVSIKIDKRNANVLSFRFKGIDIVDVAHAPASGSGYWNVYGCIPNGQKTQQKGTPAAFTITQDPMRNGGEAGEIELLFPYRSGTNAEPLDIAIRYTLRRGDSGVYGWTSVTHRRGYPPFDIEASTMALKLNPDVFDHLTVDSRRDKEMITPYDWIHGKALNLKEARLMTTGIHAGEVEHKYDYSAMFSKTPAYGWSSTKQNVGIWIINPSIEYINGAPTRIELTGHIDLKNQVPADPTLLFIWHGPHYGGLPIAIDPGESWQKVIGPFLIYCNSGATPDAMWKNALARAALEKHEWPYVWASMKGYAQADERGTVSGRLVVRDPQQPSANAAGAWVGLAVLPYTATGENGQPFRVNWETDGKHYEYWTQADRSGVFTIRNARPGKYVLYAFNDGILGDFSQTGVLVGEGKTTQLGSISWVPVRYGRQVWQIGVPNRSAEEFRIGNHYWRWADKWGGVGFKNSEAFQHGDSYWQWGLYNLYPMQFPEGINFVVGKSDWRHDWNYVQPPHQNAEGQWTGTTWRITFDMATITSGTATLRMAICGSRGNSVIVAVNGSVIGDTGTLPNSGVMHRDGIRSVETEHDFPFSESLLVKGTNYIDLTTRANNWTDGVLYDYLRLEVNDRGSGSSGTAPAATDR